MHRGTFVQALGRWMSWILAGGAALLLWVFAELSDELFNEAEHGDTVHRMDRRILESFERMRRPWLSPIAVDLTALGSPLLLSLFTTVGIVVLLATGNRRPARHLLAASIGAGALTLLLKRVLVRARPSEIRRLVEVAGYSYPSGHSLASAAILTTAAILVWEQTPRWRYRLLGVAFAGVLVGAIGASRVYLGVHYPTDVAAGISVGAAWALLVGAASRRLRERGPSGE